MSDTNPWYYDAAIAAGHSGLIEFPSGFWDWPRGKRLEWAEKISQHLRGCAKTNPSIARIIDRQPDKPLPPSAAAPVPLPPRRPWKLPLPSIRNLIYHVCPLKTNDGWRMNVRQLVRRMGVFNGQRVIAIARGEGLEPPDAVRDELAGFGCDFWELPNDPQLREVATFLPLLITVANQDERQATFYAHTKGNSTIDSRLGAELWRNEMYHQLLDEWQDCMADLGEHVACGINKIVWPEPSQSPYPTRLSTGRWMFAGTFFWFRHDLVFGHNHWRRVAMDRYGAEAWLGGMFEPEHAKSRFQPWPETQFPCPSPYNPLLYESPIRDCEYSQTAVAAYTAAEEIDGLIYTADLRQLIAIAESQLSGSTWVEIGSLAGKSLLATGLALPPGCRLISIDDGRGVFAPVTAEQAASLEGVCARLQTRHTVERITATAAEACTALADRSIDVAFIDDDHTADGFRASVRAILPKIKPGGTLCGHDYGGEWPEVVAAVDELFPRREVRPGTTIWSIRIGCES